MRMFKFVPLLTSYLYWVGPYGATHEQACFPLRNPVFLCAMVNFRLADQPQIHSTSRPCSTLRSFAKPRATLRNLLQSVFDRFELFGA